MNEKKYIVIIIAIVVIIFVLGGTAAGAGLCAFFYSAYKSDNSRTEQYSERERELLARIGEYQQREQDRVARERENAAREAELNRAAGERAKRLAKAIGDVRVTDRRSGELLQEAAREINFLAGYIGSIGGSSGGDADNNDDGK
jgi:hypothetical protein